MTSIDIVIPSYRLNEQYLIPILQMEVPVNTKVHYILIADNPNIKTSKKLEPFIEKPEVTLIKNTENQGASESRNIGINNSTANWILFLDDDVKPHPQLLNYYLKAILKNPEASGFFGPTIFPESTNSFTKGLVIGGMLYFFYYPKFHDSGRCATTSNVMVNRNAIGDIRFSKAFPKKGGGEDFAFFLDLYYKTKQSLICVKDAEVNHNWWHNGKRNYTQFMRWSYGDYELFRLFPEVTYYNFPNIIETFAVLLPILIITAVLIGSITPILFTLGGLILAEIGIEYIHMLRNDGFFKSLYVIEVVLARTSADIGRFYGQLVNKRLKDLFKRPNYSVHEVNIHYRLWAGYKFVGYILTPFILYFLWNIFFSN